MRARARKVIFDGHAFDSQAERDRYIVLRDLQRKGEISKLAIHTKFRFIVNGVPVGRGFVADFVYHDKSDAVHVEDVKGWKKSPKTGKMLPRVDKGFRMRCDLMLACFGLKVEVV